MRADYFKDNGTIKRVTETPTGIKGVVVYSPKANRNYTFGGLLNFNKKEGDEVEITVSFNRIIDIR